VIRPSGGQFGVKAVRRIHRGAVCERPFQQSPPSLVSAVAPMQRVRNPKVLLMRDRSLENRLPTVGQLVVGHTTE
jgi:hypothetical protein